MRVVGDEDVQLAHARKPAEQVEVGRPQSARISRVISDGDEDVIDRPRIRRREHARPQLMLIHAVSRAIDP